MPIPSHQWAPWESAPRSAGQRLPTHARQSSWSANADIHHGAKPRSDAPQPTPIGLANLPWRQSETDPGLGKRNIKDCCLSHGLHRGNIFAMPGLHTAPHRDIYSTATYFNSVTKEDRGKVESTIKSIKSLLPNSQRRKGERRWRTIKPKSPPTSLCKKFF